MSDEGLSELVGDLFRLVAYSLIKTFSFLCCDELLLVCQRGESEMSGQMVLFRRDLSNLLASCCFAERIGAVLLGLEC